MKPKIWVPLMMAIAVVVLVSVAGTVIASGASPQAPHQDGFAHFSGELLPGETVAPIYQLFGSQELKANLRMESPAVAGDGQLDLVVTDGEGGTPFEGTILDGEVTWANVTLQPGTNTFSLQNTSAETLQYDIWLYYVEEVPVSWAGKSLGAGEWQSHILVDFPDSGLYDFDFGLTSGRYQFFVDEEYIQKTADASGTVTYFVPAGQHLLTILQDTASAETDWSLDVSGPGAPMDVLPYTKSGGNLGGDGNDFTVEWLPVYLAEDQPVNVSLSLAGIPTDTVEVYLFEADAATPFYTVTDVYGGETLWWTTDLGSGLSRIEIVAGEENTQTLAYDLTIFPQAETPASWSGESLGAGNQSHVRFTVATAGLYDFDYGLTSGRYQFLVNPTKASAYIQKTVEVTGTVRYYLPAGTHDLVIAQDQAQPVSSWSVSIAATGIANDTLPYMKEGGNLGGVGNEFGDEWLPVALQQGQQANFRMTLTGVPEDGLVAYLYQAGSATPLYTTPVIYGGETFWWTTGLADQVNQVKLSAQGTNTTTLQYELTIEAVPTLTPAEQVTWSGISSGVGGNSKVEVDVPVAGVYHVKLEIPSGFANILISEAVKSLEHTLTQRVIEFDVPLEENAYWFEVVQSPAYTATTWTVTLSVKTLAAPQVLSVEPMTVTNDVDNLLTISGMNFQAGAVVNIGGTDLATTFVNSSQLQVTLAAGFEAGVYDVMVTNPDTQSDTLVDGVTVSNPPPPPPPPPPKAFNLFLPMLYKGSKP